MVHLSDHLRGSGCPKCNQSKGELGISRLLSSNSILYSLEYKIIESRYRYDFYLPELNILIEYDGIQHFKAVSIWGGKKALKETKVRDKAKDELARLHNTPLIRIPYTKYGELDNYLLWSISKIYKYRVGKKFYRTFLELCNKLNLPGVTTSKDISMYLTYK